MTPSLGLVVEWLDESTLGLLFGEPLPRLLGCLQSALVCSLLRVAGSHPCTARGETACTLKAACRVGAFLA